MMSATPRCLLAVGSLHHDLMIDAPHLPRRGETVTGYRWYPKFGGKGGNQAVAAARAGCSVRMLGAVGDDDFAALLRATLEREHIDTCRVATLPDRPTGMSVAISDAQGDYGAVIVSGANLAIDAGQLADEALWDGVGWLLLQNEVEPELNLAAAREAARRAVPVCLNAAPARDLDEALGALIDVLIVNALEAGALCGRPVDGAADGLAAAMALAATFRTVIVTLGGAGVVVVTRNASARHLPAVPIQVHSTHGAGDTFTGVLCAGLLSGQDIDTAVRAANALAARHVAGESVA